MQNVDSARGGKDVKVGMVNRNSPLPWVAALTTFLASAVGSVLGAAAGAPQIREVDRDGSAIAEGQAGERRPRRAERAGREIDNAIETLALKQGDSVAEIGAGDARFSLRFAEVVGPEGRVYANELGSANVRRIEERAERRQLGNLIAVEGAVDDTRLPGECCDAMMMRMVYHMLTDPMPMARSFYRALKPGGTLLILEGDPHVGRPAPRGVPENRAGMGVDPQIVIDELSAVGFQLDRHIPDWTGADYALVFRKPPR
ncbi:MAG TPA: methyltransferase domain-containing protein [Vicinamibacterales bacterium]|nr:methyltransferase domain-containing protein [Vicinamibacterales bacterium]